MKERTKKKKEEKDFFVCFGLLFWLFGCFVMNCDAYSSLLLTIVFFFIFMQLYFLIVDFPQ